MKRKIFVYMAKAVGSLSLFAAIISAGTASICGMYQPKVPEALQR